MKTSQANLTLHIPKSGALDVAQPDDSRRVICDAYLDMCLSWVEPALRWMEMKKGFSLLGAFPMPHLQPSTFQWMDLDLVPYRNLQRRKSRHSEMLGHGW